MMKRVILFAAALLAVWSAAAQGGAGGGVSFDRTVHDFGDILLSQGPVSCTFHVQNGSQEAVVIYNVVSSCGCTDVKWTREPLRPGKSGDITATYKNDEGPYPFDKTLTVYLSSTKQPVVLHLRGRCFEKEKPLEERYPVRFGPLAFAQTDIKAGNLSQGMVKGGEVVVANLGKKPLAVSFAEVSDGLSLEVVPNPVPPRSTARLHYAITASRERWGKNYYYAVPLPGGKRYASEGRPAPAEKAPGGEALVAEPNPRLGEGSAYIGLYAWTKEDFSALSSADRSRGAQPLFDESTFSFGKIKAGTPVEAVFRFKNAGKSVLKVYKADVESSRVSVQSVSDTPPGAKGEVRAHLSTDGLPAGEVLLILTLTTNSPLRPIINLYLTGWIQ